MSSGETRLREQIAEVGRRLAERGLSPGSSGNISVPLEDGGWLMTPTNSSLGHLDPETLSKLDANGQLISGAPPTKEHFLHRAVYDTRPSAGGIIHLHSTYSAAVSCMAGLNPDSCIPPLTAYFVMKVGQLPLIPYYRPGDARLGEAIAELAPAHSSVLLANHGPVVAGRNLMDAMYASEELEETAKIFLLLQGLEMSPLTEAQIAKLNQTFKS